MRIALVCDTMSAYGGAERVIEQILSLYPTADVFTVLDAVTGGYIANVYNMSSNKLARCVVQLSPRSMACTQ